VDKQGREHAPGGHSVRGIEVDEGAPRLQGEPVRWERLFADLESRFDDLAAAQERAEQADRDRVAAGAVTTLQRLRGAVGSSLRVRLATGASIAGVLRRVGPDFVLVDDDLAGEFVIPLRYVVAAEGLTAGTGPELAGVSARLDLRWMLRGIARDRSSVAVTTSGSAAIHGRDGALAEPATSEISGTIDRVGADFVEVAVHAPWEPRRAAGVRSVVLVPLRAVVLVRAVPMG
jgi:hypothetical protein